MLFNKRQITIFDFFKPITTGFWWLAATAAMGALSANSAANAANKKSNKTQANANRRYAIQAGVAFNQMEGENQNAMELMTDVNREFLLAKGKATAMSAESGVGGNVAKRRESVLRTKASEAKSKIAKDTDTNIINIAQDMLSKKIDTEAIRAEAESKKQNVFTATLLSAATSAVGSEAGGEFLNGLSLPTTGVKNTSFSNPALQKFKGGV